MKKFRKLQANNFFLKSNQIGRHCFNALNIPTDKRFQIIPQFRIRFGFCSFQIVFQAHCAFFASSVKI